MNHCCFNFWKKMNCIFRWNEIMNDINWAWDICLVIYLFICFCIVSYYNDNITYKCFYLLLFLFQNHKPLRKYIYINLVHYIFTQMKISLRSLYAKVKSLFFALNSSSLFLIFIFLSHNLLADSEGKKMSIHC